MNSLIAIGRKSACVISCTLLIFLMLVAASSSAMAQKLRAVSISAQEQHHGVNVVRSDGTVVAYWDVEGVEGPRVIPGLKDIIATTAHLALRRDGAVLTWDSKCKNDQQAAYCEYLRSRVVAGLRNIVAISQHNGSKFALDRDGTVWGWGNDDDGVITGQPAIPRPIRKGRVIKNPTRIPLPVPMVGISSGTFQGGAIDREGNVWTWGGKRFPDLHQAPGEDVVGAGGFVSRKIAGLPPAVKLDISGTAYVVTQANEVWRWGVSHINDKIYGSTIPSPASGMRNIVDVSQTSFSTALLEKDGGVWFIGHALNVDDNKYIDEPRLSTQMPPAIAISAGARITAEGEALLFADVRRGLVQRLDLGD